MTKRDPREVVLDRFFPPVVSIAGTSDDADKGMHMRAAKGSLGARLETFRFLKERGVAGRLVQAVTFETGMGKNLFMICYLVQDKHGEWQFRGAAGGAEVGSSPLRDYAWVDLGGGGWPDDFYAGGYVITRENEDVARVRLLAKNGTVMEDTVDDHLVLFVTDQSVAIPLQVELYDSAGKLLSSHKAF